MNEKILVIDDDAELRENICEILSANGFEVTLASSAEEASGLLKNDVPEIVITDFMMPGMLGTDFISHIKKQHPGVRVIMITAFATVDNAVEAMKRGADDYIAKPFKKDELLISIRKNIEENKFFKCMINIGMDEALSCISNVMRRKIIFMLFEEGKIRFMDITRKLHLDDHTKVNFHLKILRQANLITQDEDRMYLLTENGKKIIGCLKTIAYMLNNP
jgi:DNA-binding response OmpR family regulator